MRYLYSSYVIYLDTILLHKLHDVSVEIQRLSAFNLNVSRGEKSQPVPLNQRDSRGVLETGVIHHVVILNPDLVDGARVETFLYNVNTSLEFAVHQLESGDDGRITVVDIERDRVGEKQPLFCLQTLDHNVPQ